MFKKISRHFNGELKGKVIAIWGLSFKPKTDDMREAPSLEIITSLLDAGAIVKAYDPEAMDEAKHYFEDRIMYCPDKYDALIDADCLAVLTEWPEFRVPNFNIVKRLMNEFTLFDGRNIYSAKEIYSLGFNYECIGVKKVKKKSTNKILKLVV